MESNVDNKTSSRSFKSPELPTEIKPVAEIPKETTIPHVSFHRLFRFATWPEYAGIIFGIFLAILSAFFMPLGVIVYGEFTTILVDRATRTGTSTETIVLSFFGGGKIL